VGVNAQRFGNDPKYTSSVLQNVVVPKTQQPPALRCQELVASAVGIWDIMLSTVCFDDQSRFDAREVDDVGWNGKLPAVAMTQLPLPELAP
jgi:hypothetical protein